MWAFFPLVAAVPAHGDDSWRLDPRVAPTSQTIDLTLDPAREGCEGRVQIDLEVREPVASFRLNSEGPTLQHWRMTGSQGKVEASLTDDGKGFLTVSVGEPLPPGDYTLEIAFTQEFNQKGEAIYRTRSGGEPYIFSHFQYIYARQAFPCWDEPGGRSDAMSRQPRRGVGSELAAGLPGLDLARVGEDTAARVVPQAVDGQALVLLPADDGSDVPLEVGRNRLPRLERRALGAIGFGRHGDLPGSGWRRGRCLSGAWPKC